MGGSGAQCEPSSGQCPCQPGAGGRDCSECQDGYYPSPSGSSCVPCGCSPGGAESAACNQTTGQCSCRDGVGRAVAGRLVCDRVLQGYFCPALDHTSSEAEAGTLQNRPVEVETRPPYSGSGTLHLRTGDQFASAPIAVPVSGYYQLVLRYSTEPTAEPGHLDFEITEVGSPLPGFSPSPCPPLDSETGSVRVLEQGQGLALRHHQQLCLVETAWYQVTISAAGLWSSLLLDSIVLLPELSSLAVFQRPGSLQRFLALRCPDRQLALATRAEALEGECGEMTCAAMLELLNGAVGTLHGSSSSHHHTLSLTPIPPACNCSAEGSTGQCSYLGCQCRPGVGGAQCAGCMPGYSNFSSAGCRSVRPTQRKGLSDIPLSPASPLTPAHVTATRQVLSRRCVRQALGSAPARATWLAGAVKPALKEPSASILFDQMAASCVCAQAMAASVRPAQT